MVKYNLVVYSLMTFEKQICKKCKQLTICYLMNIHDWYCDGCFGWVVCDANKKDVIAEIFCGIEDLESDRMAVE